MGIDQVLHKSNSIIQFMIEKLDIFVYFTFFI